MHSYDANQSSVTQDILTPWSLFLLCQQEYFLVCMQVVTATITMTSEEALTNEGL